MNINIEYKNNIIILGAGSSIEYGLPSWAELSELIKIKLNNSIDKYLYSKEINEWLCLIPGTYKTIDDCIKYESVKYKENGHLIENEIFRIMKDVFSELYKNNDNGWIRKFNDKILVNNLPIHTRMYFINYNYDHVLDNNLLNYNYLSEKEKLIYEERLDQLGKNTVEVFCPHGSLYESLDFDIDYSQLNKVTDTIKSRSKNNEKYLNAISCHDGDSHEFNGYEIGTNLYILGLGGGLETNFNNLNFNFRIDNIYITNKSGNAKYIKEYLISKFNITEDKICFYNDCKELIKNSFNNLKK